MKTANTFTQGVSLMKAIIEKMDGINKWLKRFIVEVLGLL